MIVVAYPSDETLEFSTVCRAKCIEAVGDPKWLNQSADLSRELKQAAAQLDAAKATYLGILLDEIDGPEYRSLVRRLKRYQGHGRVYTHSPFDKDAVRATVALAAAQAFGRVWVTAKSGIARQVNPLDEEAFQTKRRIINTVYSRRIRTHDDAFRMPHTALLGVEAFTPATFQEVMQGVALTRATILPFPDAWGLFKSPYEEERYTLSCRLLLKHTIPSRVRSILEAGACEGAMTKHLLRAFPQARICALEPHPVFVRRMRARFHGDSRIDIVQRSISRAVLKADLVVMAEMLYYVEQDLKPILRRIQARYLMTSSEGEFDLQLARTLSQFKWRVLEEQNLASRFEAIDGGNLFCRREGTTIRIWARGLD
jgi:hypothetical protein